MPTAPPKGSVLLALLRQRSGTLEYSKKRESSREQTGWAMARARCCGRLAACAGLLLSRPALLVLLVVTAQQATPAAAASAQAGVLVPLAATAQLPPLDEHCSSEAQVVHCGQLSLFDAGRQECCEAFRPSPSPVASSPFVGWGVVSGVARPDLEELAAAAANASSSTRASAPDWGNCMQTAVVDVPLFGSAADRSVAVVQQSVPLLSRDAIAAVKAAALAKLAPPLREQVANLTRVHNVSGFVHPAGIVGPAEMVLLKQRLADGTKQQQVALESLLTGEGVQPKVYPGGWSVPTDTPETWQGPYVLSVVDAKWSGFNTGRVVCPANYPAGAPTAICAHTSFVELDAQQAYKQALASWATGDARYAVSAHARKHVNASCACMAAMCRCHVTCPNMQRRPTCSASSTAGQPTTRHGAICIKTGHWRCASLRQACMCARGAATALTLVRQLLLPPRRPLPTPAHAPCIFAGGWLGLRRSCTGAGAGARCRAARPAGQVHGVDGWRVDASDGLLRQQLHACSRGRWHASPVRQLAFDDSGMLCDCRPTNRQSRALRGRAGTVSCDGG